MNMNRTPSKEELAAILAKCHDDAANHVIWVDFDGDVHVDPIPPGLSPVGFEASKKGKMKFRLETCGRGNAYVGESAAVDEKWVQDLFRSLVRLWEEDFQGYCDDFLR